MWIWKDQYNQLIRSGEFWSNEYHTLQERKRISDRRYDDALANKQKTINDLMEQLELLKSTQEELQEYKQKYADEVQKRLELVKLLENIT